MKDIPKDEPLYVGFPDASALRRDVLEAARKSVTTQKAHERLREIQDQKLATRTDLVRVLKELRDELAKLQMVLPHREVKEPAAPPVQVSEAKKRAVDSKVDKIEAALAEIEERLRAL